MSRSANAASNGKSLDKLRQELVKIASETSGAIITEASVTKVGEVLAPESRGQARELVEGWGFVTSALKSGEKEGAVADRAAGGGLVARDQTFVAPGIAEDALEAIVGAREIGVVVAGEDPRSEDLGGGEHVLERGFPGGPGMARHGRADVREDRIERALEAFGRIVLTEELGGANDEAPEEANVLSRLLGEVQSDAEMLAQLLQEEGSAPFFLSPSSRASMTCVRRFRVSSPGAWRG